MDADTSLRFCDLVRDIPQPRLGELMAVVNSSPGVGAAFRGLCRNYANYGAKTGAWLDNPDLDQFLEIGGPDMPGPRQCILVRRDGVRLVQTPEANTNAAKHWLTFEEYELVFGEHPSDIFARRWDDQLRYYDRWRRLAARDLAMTEFNVCYQTSAGGVATTVITAPDRASIHIWMNQHKYRPVHVEPADAGGNDAVS